MGNPGGYSHGILFPEFPNTSSKYDDALMVICPIFLKSGVTSLQQALMATSYLIYTEGLQETAHRESTSGSTQHHRILSSL